MKKMRYHRKRWDIMIKSIFERQLENEPISQKWCLRDVIAHLTWYEKELLDALEKQSQVDSEFWNMEVEKRNDMIYRKTQEHSLNEIIQESKRTFEELIDVVATISDEDLNSDTYVKRKKGTRVTHDFIGGINFWHYEEHEDVLVNLFDLDYQC